MGIETERYQRQDKNIIRRTSLSWRETNPVKSIMTLKDCQVYGLDIDHSGRVIPDYYMGYLYVLSGNNEVDSQARLFAVSHEPDEFVSAEEAIECVLGSSGNIPLTLLEKVNVRIYGDCTFEVLNRDDLNGMKLSAIDVMFGKYGLSRVINKLEH